MNNIQDPRITKYLTNEMTAKEKADFEKELLNNRELNAMVVDLKPLFDSLQTELPKEKLPIAHVDSDVDLTSKIKKLFMVGIPVAAVATVAFVVLTPELKDFESGSKTDDKVVIETYEQENTEGKKSVKAKSAPARMQKGIGTPEAASALGKRSGQLNSLESDSDFSGGAGVHLSYIPTESRQIGIMPPMPHGKVNTEAYDKISSNEFKKVTTAPLSTFSIDVDTASYANVRRFLNRNQLPPQDAVRIEEMVNYFRYAYKAPSGNKPFSVHTEMTTAPWNKKSKLLRVGLKGREIDWSERKATNIVFLLDVSGSMNDFNKLPLVKQGLKLMIDNLDKNDSVAIVVYAGASGLVLPATKGSDKEEILAALDRLSAGGGTNGGAGIKLAYDIAKQNFIKDGLNRVILATDGDFNVGTSSRTQLDELIIEQAKSDVFLTVLGFGSGNLKDSQMESLANKGNGNYAYIDSYKEAKKVLVEQVGGTMMTIAKDVKIQVEFNPAKVSAYRLIGYENRLLNKEDFNDDTKDAGEIGAGHTVTALYEIVPAGESIPNPSVDKLKYQKDKAPKKLEDNNSGAEEEWLTVKLRYKEPTSDRSKKMEFPVKGKASEFRKADPETQFAAAVASFGMKLRNSTHVSKMSYADLLVIAHRNKGRDQKGYRQEFIELINKASKISTKK